MELREDIVGFTLLGINKIGETVRIKLFNYYKERNVQLVYNGLLFETPSMMLNRKIKRVDYSNTLGFKAITQLRYLDYNPTNFKQLLIVLEGSTDDFKQELICVFSNYNLYQL